MRLLARAAVPLAGSDEVRRIAEVDLLELAGDKCSQGSRRTRGDRVSDAPAGAGSIAAPAAGTTRRKAVLLVAHTCPEFAPI
jgi:hypothetical protein